MNTKRMIEYSKQCIETPSVVGYYPEIHQYLSETLKDIGYSMFVDHKHTAYVHIPGKDTSKTICIGSHLDTIGLIVRHINEDGTLSIRQLGGINYHSIEGENVYIHTRDHKTYTGMVICTSHSVHVFDDAKTISRDENTMRILLDEDVHTPEEVYELGIDHGDLISIEPRFTLTSSGYIKSRHIDDKACVGVCLEILHTLKETNQTPTYNTLFAFPIFEEIGHGGAYVPEYVDEYLALDIGLIGPDYHGSEKTVSIAAADAYSPYDWGFTTKLRNIAKEKNIQACLDVYYRYGTDANAAIRSGNNLLAGCIGPGCMNSHGYERCHIQALIETANLTMAYILQEK